MEVRDRTRGASTQHLLPVLVGAWLQERCPPGTAHGATGCLWSWEEPSFQLAARNWGSLEGRGEGERVDRDSSSGGRFSSTETSRL